MESFPSKTTYAIQGMVCFEKECSRFQIEKGEDKIELFLDWHSFTLSRTTENTDRFEWEKIFLECV